MRRWLDQPAGKVAPGAAGSRLGTVVTSCCPGGAPPLPQVPERQGDDQQLRSEQLWPSRSTFVPSLKANTFGVGVRFPGARSG
jgi:hypothetical protein